MQYKGNVLCALPNPFGSTSVMLCMWMYFCKFIRNTISFLIICSMFFFQVASSCLTSLYILDSQSMVELLNTFIGLHSNSSLTSNLQFELSHILEGDVKAQIKEKIINSVKIVLKTVVLVYACFVGKFKSFFYIIQGFLCIKFIHIEYKLKFMCSFKG